jgi:disulfide bond formation protein DsbB
MILLDRLLAISTTYPRLQLAGVGVVGVALVGGGVFLARTMNLAACPLCILQRMLYLLLALEALVMLPWARGMGIRFVALIMAGTAATGVWIAAYQTWLQRFARGVSCTADQPWWEQFVNWAGTQSPALFEATGMCDEAGWVFLGLSIAEWSLVAFSSMTVVSIHAIFRRTQQTTIERTGLASRF